MREVAERWVQLAHGRHEASTERSLKFVQMVIPEKSTVLREISGLEITGPMPVYHLMIESLRSESWFLDALPLLRKIETPFLTIDTHLSAHGAQEVFANLVDRLLPNRSDQVRDVECDVSRWTQGDLVARFFALPFFSPISEPGSVQMSALAREIIPIVESHLPTGNI